MTEIDMSKFTYQGEPEIGEAFRQGDLTFVRLAKRPSGLTEMKDNIVAIGEGRDHFHRAKGAAVQVLEPQSKLEIDIDGSMEEVFRVVDSKQEFQVAHELPSGERANHHTLKGIPDGIFAVLREREVDPFAKEGDKVQTVRD